MYNALPAHACCQVGHLITCCEHRGAVSIGADQVFVAVILVLVVEAADGDARDCNSTTTLQCALSMKNGCSMSKFVLGYKLLMAMSGTATANEHQNVYVCALENGHDISKLVLGYKLLMAGC